MDPMTMLQSAPTGGGGSGPSLPPISGGDARSSSGDVGGGDLTTTGPFAAGTGNSATGRPGTSRAPSRSSGGRLVLAAGILGAAWIAAARLS